ncbi:YwaF family protein [Streptococcus oricebi]|uniref:TIGR02206 family membrane protein n=1 Tax=Streptococcus oricebi TaxID=1547447 RepID=A0ABS5B1I5_9STRE|nr:TIGR02206 family membrane protein [Streptococcus oricebi]MBP2622678.1 TIGR02206 family membrane protein [Streptococcus oricebi]
MSDFFTVHKGQLPELNSLWYGLTMIGLIIILYSSAQYSRSRSYQKFFIGLQSLQLISLYTWYGLTLTSLAESLPLYHCRMAMFVVLLFPERSPYKQYFALLGVFGAICALVYPVLDPYPFPHITFFSFFIGHMALLGNSLIYLFNHYDVKRLSREKIISYTLTINASLMLINQLTDGDYGFLSKPPLLGNQGFFFNFVSVSAVLIVAILLLNEIFRRYQAKTFLNAFAFKKLNK